MRRLLILLTLLPALIQAQTYSPDRLSFTKPGYSNKATFRSEWGTATPVTPAVDYSAEADSLFVRMGEESYTPNATRKGYINDFITSLKTNGVWSKLDALYVFAAPSEDVALLNWVSRSYTATNTSAVFTAENYYAGGTGKYIDTKYNPASTNLYLQNDAGSGIYVEQIGTTNSGVDYGIVKTTLSNLYESRATVDNILYASNSGGTGTIAHAPASGLQSISRLSASNYQVYVNADSINETNTSAGVPDTTMFIFAYSDSGNPANYNDSKISLFYIGGGLTRDQHDTFQSLAETYLFNIRTVADVWILAGQSNASGAAYVDSITGSNYKAQLDSGYIFDYDTSGVWELLKPGVNGQTDALAFGIETSFLKNLATYKEANQYIIKHTSVGSTLEVEWDPKTPANEYYILTQVIGQAISKLRTLHLTPKIKGFIWIQGESDAASVPYSQAYLANLTEMMDSITNYCDSINLVNKQTTTLLRVVGKQINKGTLTPYRAAVRSAQASWCAANDGILIDTDGYTLRYDSIHYNSNSLVQMGIDIYNAVKDE